MMEQVYFVLTDRCNLSCSHCIRDSSPQRSNRADPALVTRCIDDIARHWPGAQILLSGGEPTLHPDFDSILSHALASGLSVNINSNGNTPFFQAAKLQPLAGHRQLSVQISLDGGESDHDAIRGQDSFRRALRTLQRLREAGIRCAVSTTVTQASFFDAAPDFLQSLDDLGLSHIAIKRATLAGRASEGIVLSTADWNRNVYRIREMNFRTRIKIFPMYDFARLRDVDSDALARLPATVAARNCGAGSSKAYVYPDGSVCACTCFRDLPMGNLHSSSIGQILSLPPDFVVTDPACKGCAYFAICNGGCLGSGYNSSGRIGAPDPRCPIHEDRVAPRIPLRSA